jgi:hypothetical protein
MPRCTPRARTRVERIGQQLRRSSEDEVSALPQLPDTCDGARQARDGAARSGLMRRTKKRRCGPLHESASRLFHVHARASCLIAGRGSRPRAEEQSPCAARRSARQLVSIRACCGRMGKAGAPLPVGRCVMSRYRPQCRSLLGAQSSGTEIATDSFKGAFEVQWIKLELAQISGALRKRVQFESIRGWGSGMGPWNGL